MTFLQTLLGVSFSPSPYEERYWSQVASPVTTAGVMVSSETALKLSVVYACDRLLSETIASLPALVYERLADGGRRRAANHPLYDVLHRQPNEQQTAFEFFDFMTHCAIMRGNAYARILPGPRGFADQLRPLHPDRVVEQPLAGGRARYLVRGADGTREMLNDSDILHLKGMSADGQTGVSFITYARESLGLSLAAERYGARFFQNNAQPGGVLQTENKLPPDALQRLKESWEEMHSGANQHRVAVLEQGLKWQDVGLSQKDSQFMELRTFQAEDVCRWLRVPPHMVGVTASATTWGSGIEQLGIGFVVYTLMPWLVRWQQAISRDLILVPDKYFVEFLVDALLRGDQGSRYSAYAIGRQWGWLSPNDVRRLENMNPRPDEDGDAYDQAAGASVPPVTVQAPPPSAKPQPSGGAGGAPGAHYEQLVREAAGRVVRKEIAALSRAARRNGSRDAWPEAVAEFYSDHAEFVAQSLRVSRELAERYVAEQVAELQAGPSAMSDWETRRAGDLVALVLGAAKTTEPGEPVSASVSERLLEAVRSVGAALHDAPQSQAPVIYIANNMPQAKPVQVMAPVTVENHVAVEPTPIANQVTVEPAPTSVVVNTPRIRAQHTKVTRSRKDGAEMTGTESTFDYEDEP